MKALKLAFLLLLVSVGADAVFGSIALAGGQSVIPGSPAPHLTAERVAFMLGRLRVPTVTATVQAGGTCATSCGPGPQASCTKSCSGSQSCSASCSGGKALCSCE